MPEPRPRSPAQIEASRRNGARSKGPVTPDGKARASRNALTHGLCAMQHLVVEGEIPGHLDELIARMTEETGAVGEVETRIARRLAIAFWKGERAERMEVAILDAAPTTRLNGYQHEEADPLTTFDVRRFNAVRGQQAQIGREISRCLKELRQLRKDARDECTDEPESAWEFEPEVTLRNEPEGPPPPANDDAIVDLDEMQNEPASPRGPAAEGVTGETSGMRNEPGEGFGIALDDPRLMPDSRLFGRWDGAEVATAALSRGIRAG